MRSFSLLPIWTTTNSSCFGPDWALGKTKKKWMQAVWMNNSHVLGAYRHKLFKRITNTFIGKGCQISKTASYSAKNAFQLEIPYFSQSSYCGSRKLNIIRSKLTTPLGKKLFDRTKDAAHTCELCQDSTYPRRANGQVCKIRKTKPRNP